MVSNLTVCDIKLKVLKFLHSSQLLIRSRFISYIINLLLPKSWETIPVSFILHNNSYRAFLFPHFLIVRVVFISYGSGVLFFFHYLKCIFNFWFKDSCNNIILFYFLILCNIKMLLSIVRKKLWGLIYFIYILLYYNKILLLNNFVTNK